MSVDCPPLDGFPWALPNQTVVLQCGTGTKSRTCGLSGAYGPIIDNCQPLQCQSDHGFPTSTGGQTATIPCGHGFSGNETRFCTISGQWQQPDRSGCRPLFCTASDGFPAVQAGSVVNIPCSNGSGLSSRTCFSNGTYSVIDKSQCEPLSCLPDLGFPSTAVSTKAKIACGPGFYGFQMRHCKHVSNSAVWDDPITSGCIPIYCKPTNGLGYTRAGTIGEFGCSNGFQGSVEAFCTLNGTYSMSTFNNTCTELFCEAEDGFSRTQAGQMAFRSCNPGQIGIASRSCSNLVRFHLFYSTLFFVNIGNIWSH